MARSMARRACRTLLLVGERVGVAVLGGRAQPVVGEVAELLLDRPQPLDDLLGVSHRGSLRRQRVGEQLGGVADVEAGGAEVHRAPRVRRRRRAGRVAPPAAAGWRRPCGRGSRRRARAASTAYAPPAPQHRPSSSVSTQRVGGREHGADRAVRVLHVAEVARVLHDDVAPGVAERQRAAASASHSEKSRTRAENACASGVPSRRP